MKTTRRYGKRADLALSTWVKLARGFSVFSKATIRDIAHYGLTEPQFGVLEALGHLGTMTFTQLCQKRLVSGGNMTVVVDNLEKRGLVERRHCEEDRRAIYVRLTKKGEAMFRDIFPKHARVVTELASALTAREQKTLGVLLKKLGLALVEREQRSHAIYYGKTKKERHER
jgi:MarR family 2-MHQ and catechol resistance regulon transcriptional repressor